MSAEEHADVWAIVEVMGHGRFAGRVSQCEAFGPPLLRVEVPESEGQPAFEKHFGPNAIFSVTPCDEGFARAAAGRFQAPPLALVELAALLDRPAIGGPPASDEDVDYPW